MVIITMPTIITKKYCRCFLKNDPFCDNYHNAHKDHNHHKKKCRAVLKNDPSYGNNHKDHNHHKKKIVELF